MAKSRLEELIKTLDQDNMSVRTDILALYKKSLYVWYRNHYMSEPMLMVVAVFNAASYARIESVDGFEEAVDDYVKSHDEGDPEINEHLKETIMFNSIALKEL